MWLDADMHIWDWFCSYFTALCEFGAVKFDFLMEKNVEWNFKYYIFIAAMPLFGSISFVHGFQLNANKYLGFFVTTFMLRYGYCSHWVIREFCIKEKKYSPMWSKHKIPVNISSELRIIDKYEKGKYMRTKEIISKCQKIRGYRS